MRSIQQYQEELDQNLLKINDYANRCDKEYSKYSNRWQIYADSDYETRIALSMDYSFYQKIDNEWPLFRASLRNPYFFHCQDPANKNYYYISDKISLWYANILKYTQARAWVIRYTGNERTNIYIENGKITTTTQESNDQEYISITTVNHQLKEKEVSTSQQNVIGNISDLLIEEQDIAMRSEVDEIVIITWPAWSGKTNALLHRVDYLISELKIEASQIGIFCYNVGLKKYLQASLKGIIDNAIDIYSLDQWWYEMLNLTGFDKTKDFDSRVSISVENVRNFIDYMKWTWTSENIYKEIVKWKSMDLMRTVKKTNREGIVSEKKIKYGKYNEIQDINYEKLYNKYCDFSNINFELADMNNTDIQFLLSGLLRILLRIERERVEEVNRGKRIGKGDYKDKFYGFKNQWWIQLDTSYRHIFIDEFQDIPNFKLFLLKKFSRWGMTIAWDITQSIFTDPKTWDINLGFKYDYVNRLTVSHRWTLETIRFANALFGLEEWDNNLSQFATSSWGKPVICKISKTGKFIELLKLGISKYPNASFLIACPTRKSCDMINDLFKKEWINWYIARSDAWDFSQNIHISTYQGIKWLEFDFVFIFWIEEFLQWNFKNQINIIYTVITRARMRVLFFSEYDSPNFDKIINWINANLYELKKY